MAFLRVDKKKSGQYIRIVQSYKQDGKAKHRTLYSLGKVEDYTAAQLENLARKFIELAGKSLDDICGGDFSEQGRYNYGYALVIKSLWQTFNIDELARKISNKRTRIQFNWQAALKLMIAERINDPCSKLGNSNNQSEYFGLTQEKVDLQHLYRTLDVLSSEEELVKRHIFTQHRSLFTTVLDVVFYDVTTLYFDSQVEEEGAIRQKGFSKDGKAHKTQVVLGLLVDKNRNPVTYQVYQGNTYEGGTMIDALKVMRKNYVIDNVIVVADAAMIDKANRDFMVEGGIGYIIGDSIKGLGKKIQSKLMDRTQFETLVSTKDNTISYREVNYKGRRIICTYSTKRARKDEYERQKLIDKAQAMLDEPSKYKAVKKRGAGRFIYSDDDGNPISMNEDKIAADKKYDGFKAISTTTTESVETILTKYRDLFEVEHSFRALKSQLEIRPMFHWNSQRILGHIAMSFIAFTFINHLKLITKLSYSALVKSIDKMQLSEIKDNKANKTVYVRSKVNEAQQILINKLRLQIPKDANPQSTINQYFTY